MNHGKSGVGDGIYFFDTYALIEVFQGAKAYEQYRYARVITSFLNLYEFYYCLRKSYTQREVKVAFDTLVPFCVPLRFASLVEASEFRLQVKRDLSYADCLGYIVALKLGIKFLTGDTAFQDLPRVEFVRSS